MKKDDTLKLTKEEAEAVAKSAIAAFRRALGEDEGASGAKPDDTLEQQVAQFWATHVVLR